MVGNANGTGMATSTVTPPSDGVESRIIGLERQVTQLTRQRDDLARDVENLCMQTGDASVLSASSVLSERIYYAEKELTICQRQLEAKTAECNSLREDNKALKESKRTSDNSWKEQKSANKSLEKELSFYQQQSARAMADRDKAVWEAEDLRHQNLNIENELRKLEGRVLSEQSARQQAESTLEQAKQELAELQEQVAKSSTLPLLEKELEQLKHDKEEFRRATSTLQEQLETLRQQLNAEQNKTTEAFEQVSQAQHELNTYKQLAKEKEEHISKDKQAVEEELKKLREAYESLEFRADEAEGSLAAAQAEVEVLRRKTDEQLEGQRVNFGNHLSQVEIRYQQERDDLKTQLETEAELRSKLQSELDELASQKVKALMRLSEEQEKATKATEDAEALREQLQELKVQLSKAQSASDAVGQTTIVSPKLETRRQTTTRGFWGAQR